MELLLIEGAAILITIYEIAKQAGEHGEFQHETIGQPAGDTGSSLYM
jgi:hypothetical protein